MVSKKDEKKPSTEKTALQKKEIKEIVEETVEETLEKLAEDPADKHVVEEEKKEEGSAFSTPVMSPESTEGDTKEVAEEMPSEDHEASETPSPVVSEIAASEASSVEPIAEEKPEKEDVSVAPSVTAPVAPTVEPMGGAESTAPMQPAKKSSWLGVFLLIVLLGILAGVGWYAYTNKMIPTQLFSLAGITGHTAPTPVMHKTPTATPTQTVNLTQYTISVLNGSGVPGAAAKIKDDLTTAGFTVSNTGNASASDATDTVIAAKTTVSKDYLDKLTEELQKTYSVSATVGALDSSATTDVTVTLGSSTAH